MGSWTHKPAKRQAAKKDRQAARRNFEGGAAYDEFIRTDGGPMTMHEMYGDGSSHAACQHCGGCKHCDHNGCSARPNVRANRADAGATGD